MDLATAHALAADLITRAEAAIVTTLANGRPQTRAMFNLRRRGQFSGLAPFFDRHGDGYTVYLTTNTSSPKVAEVRANPAVSIYYAVPQEFLGLMLGGDLEIVTDRAIRELLWQPGWERYYPQGPQDPDHTVLRLRPTEAKLYHQLQFARLL